MSWTHDRARVASLSRSRATDDPDLVEARRNLRVARLEERISRELAASPALTEEDRVRLAAPLVSILEPPDEVTCRRLLAILHRERVTDAS